jgi:hypothetical protein
MKLHALYLAGAVVAAAIPFSAGAQSMPAYGQTTAGVAQTTPTKDACAPGWVWVPNGYVHQGRWEPAHCAFRDYQQNW